MIRRLWGDNWAGNHLESAICWLDYHEDLKPAKFWGWLWTRLDSWNQRRREQA